MFTPFFKRLRTLVGSQQPQTIRSRMKICDNKNNNQNCAMALYTTEELRNIVYDLVRTIKDPEKPATLEDLNVVYEEGIEVTQGLDNTVYLITVEFTPTIAHCSLATMIGLCIRVKLKRNLLPKYKLDVIVKKGTHITEDAVNKQINDKERVAAAMENSTLQDLVEACIKEEN